jgi:uncharacterized protein involved in type VI secretion and phage assembly
MIAEAKKAAAAGLADTCKPRYYGKYRGTVVNNVDPKGQGRIQVLVPQIMPAPLASWAMMCTPVGGIQNGMFAVPPPKTGVWVEFEQGDIDYPIWTGCFLGAGFEAPKQAPTVNPFFQSITLQTPTQNCVVIDDTPVTGGVIIKIRGGAKITVTDIGIEIDNGKQASIKMIGPTIQIDASVVSINGSNLTILK